MFSIGKAYSEKKAHKYVPLFYSSLLFKSHWNGQHRNVLREEKIHCKYFLDNNKNIYAYRNDTLTPGKPQSTEMLLGEPNWAPSGHATPAQKDAGYKRYSYLVAIPHQKLFFFFFLFSLILKVFWKIRITKKYIFFLSEVFSSAL